MITAIAAALSMASASATPVDVTIVRQGDKTVAIVPWFFRGGTPTAVETARSTIERFFDRAGYDRISEVRVRHAWPHEEVLTGPEQEPFPPLPTDAELRRLGHSLGVDMVCAGDLCWHTRSIWVALGPKTKSTCTVNMKMVDLDAGSTVLLNRDVTADDTAEESGFQTAAGIISGGLVTVVSGGPETPHEQRAAQVALSEAFEPWLEGIFGRH